MYLEKRVELKALNTVVRLLEFHKRKMDGWKHRVPNGNLILY